MITGRRAAALERMVKAGDPAQPAAARVGPMPCQDRFVQRRDLLPRRRQGAFHPIKPAQDDLELSHPRYARNCVFGINFPEAARGD